MSGNIAALQRHVASLQADSDFGKPDIDNRDLHKAATWQKSAASQENIAAMLANIAALRLYIDALSPYIAALQAYVAAM